MAEKLLTAIPRPLREQYEKGLAAIQRQNLDYAIAIFDQVLQKEPGFYACREALRAAQAKRAGKKGGFLKKMFGAATSSPLMAKGQLALRSNPAEAIHIAEQILNSDPHNVAAHKMLADAALALDLPRTAALSLEIAFRNSPDREVAIKLGQALAQSGQSEKGENILAELASTFPNDPEIAKVLKNVSARRTMSEGGYEALEGGGGSYRDILKDKQEAAALEQENRAVKNEDVAGRLLAEYEARIAQEPGNLRLLRSAAELYTQKKQFDKALEYYNRIQAMSYHGQCCAKRGMNDLAARTLQNAIREKPTFDDEKKELIYALGCVLEKMGKKDEAIEQFKLIYETDIAYKDVAAKVDAYYSGQ